MELHELKQHIEEFFADTILCCTQDRNELTLEVARENSKTVCQQLRDEFQFEQLIDVCGVDYLHYGLAEWQTNAATASGFERGTQVLQDNDVKWDKPRFAVVYHLLSLENNIRLRLRSFVSEDDMRIDSLIDVWAAANWFEREAFDMFGILFDGHPDLRRILSDYGFIGHAFRKDFPLSGHVQVRYDKAQGRVIYEPVDIEPRVLVPKTIRHDNRYQVSVPLPEKQEDNK